jgi:hypothetical protein
LLALIPKSIKSSLQLGHFELADQISLLAITLLPLDDNQKRFAVHTLTGCYRPFRHWNFSFVGTFAFIFLKTIHEIRMKNLTNQFHDHKKSPTPSLILTPFHSVAAFGLCLPCKHGSVAHPFSAYSPEKRPMFKPCIGFI